MAVLPQIKELFEAQWNAPPMPTDITPGQLRETMHAMIDHSYVAVPARREPVAIERDISIPAIAVRSGFACTAQTIGRTCPAKFTFMVAGSSWARWTRATAPVARWQTRSAAW